MRLFKSISLNKCFLFSGTLVALVALHVYINMVYIENFAAIGRELWQSSRANRHTRNMSYDIRGDPYPNRFNPYISPWGVSSLKQWEQAGMGVPSPPHQMYKNNSYLTPKQFSTYSRGIIINPDRVIKKGYLKGWTIPGDSPSTWLNPVLLNHRKRWNWYNLW